jgi:hypothetical protein
MDPLDATDHRVDISEHLNGLGIGGRLAQPSGGFSSKELAGSDLETLDPGGGYRFRPQQDAGQGLGVNEARRLEVQACDGRLGVGDVGGDLAVEPEGASDKTVGNVRCVVAPLVVLSSGAALPARLSDSSGLSEHLLTTLIFARLGR